MLSLSPQLLIASARSLVGTGAVGAVLDPATDAEGELRPAWDLHFIQRCGHLSHRDPETGESSWPLPPGMSREELESFGTERGVLQKTPEAGDIFLQYGPSRKAFVHAGIVMAVLGSGSYLPGKPYHDLYTVEGDTGPLGQLYGGCILRVRRRLRPGAGDRFLRWVQLGAAPHPIADSMRAA